VGWILGTHWWPYQRPTFVTPPFAGYTSGHSTFSRAAAEILTLLTGDPFFPSGLGRFDIVENQFLVFEEGPSENFSLQWATYRDASDQTSLSRIWGGIHPPIDDIRGRIIGEKIGKEAFELAKAYFEGSVAEEDVMEEQEILYPNPTSNDVWVFTNSNDHSISSEIFDSSGALVARATHQVQENLISLSIGHLSSGIYFIKLNGKDSRTFRVIKK
jgi:hypothetical protein